MQELFTTTCDWRVASMGWMYTLFFVLLGVSAAVWGGWLERVGPRRPALFRPCAGAAVSFSAPSASTSTTLVAVAGLRRHWRRRSRLGYISPVSTLVKWFPDRRGMATGMAIMGFGGGAMIGAPLANLLMNYFKTSTSVGAWETFLAMGAIYFCFMMIGAFRYRIRPPAGAQRAGRRPKSHAMISQLQRAPQRRAQDPQFWLIWWVLCMNVSAGIGVIGMASPMLQEIFAGNLIVCPE